MGYRTSSDIVFLHGLEIDTVIGIWDWERRIKQPLIVDLDLAADVARAARSDSIDDTVDYKAVTQRILRIAGDHEFLLVETLAEHIAATILEEFDVPWLRLKINKRGAVRQARDVGVIIERAVADGR